MRLGSRTVAGSSTNANDGYLVVTAAAGSQRSAIVFSDFDNGEVVQAFTFEGDFRIGNGTQNPADGFSVNYVRANDPVLANVAEGATRARMATSGPPVQTVRVTCPKKVTTTGISIGFDAWDSGAPAGHCAL